MSRKITLIGNVNIDLVMGPSPAWPRFGTEVVLPNSEWRVGGASGNSALALQALHADFRIVANRGSDHFGKWLAEPFGTKSKAWSVSQRSTGLSVGITHPDGERTFFTTLGHLDDFSLDDVIRQLPPSPEAGEIALLSGVFVMPSLLKNYGELIAILKQRGFAIALDTGWPTTGWTQSNRQDILGWCASCDHLLLNEIEARSLIGFIDDPVENVALAMTDILAADGTMVMKRGAQGALACKNRKLVTQPAPQSEVIDTIGAGDVFNAAYLWALSQGKDLATAVKLAVETASTAIATQPRRYRALEKTANV
jgi:sugar/nucleoside kinase (ribokinase family)